MSGPATIPPAPPAAHGIIPSDMETVEVFRRIKAAKLFDEKDARIKEMLDQIEEVSARLGTDRQAPSDQEKARTLVHEFTNYMHQLLLLNEIGWGSKSI